MSLETDQNRAAQNDSKTLIFRIISACLHNTQADMQLRLCQLEKYLPTSGIRKQSAKSVSFQMFWPTKIGNEGLWSMSGISKNKCNEQTQRKNATNNRPKWNQILAIPCEGGPIGDVARHSQNQNPHKTRKRYRPRIPWQKTVASEAKERGIEKVYKDNAMIKRLKWNCVEVTIPCADQLLMKLRSH